MVGHGQRTAMAYQPRLDAHHSFDLAGASGVAVYFAVLFALGFRLKDFAKRGAS